MPMTPPQTAPAPPGAATCPAPLCLRHRQELAHRGQQDGMRHRQLQDPIRAAELCQKSPISLAEHVVVHKHEQAHGGRHEAESA